LGPEEWEKVDHVPNPGSHFPLISHLPFTSGLTVAHPLPKPLLIMSSFTTYIIGFVILVVGLAMAAYLLDVPAMWIAVGIVVALGIGVITATSRTKMKDPPGPASGP
jgi:positive regulator of sigma E activity